MTLETLTAEQRGVVDAWMVPGPHPYYHYEMKRRLRQEWPMLALALDAMAYATTRERTTTP